MIQDCVRHPRGRPLLGDYSLYGTELADENNQGN